MEKFKDIALTLLFIGLTTILVLSYITVPYGKQ